MLSDGAHLSFPPQILNFPETVYAAAKTRIRSATRICLAIRLASAASSWWPAKMWSITAWTFSSRAWLLAGRLSAFVTKPGIRSSSQPGRAPALAWRAWCAAQLGFARSLAIGCRIFASGSSSRHGRPPPASRRRHRQSRFARNCSEDCVVRVCSLSIVVLLYEIKCNSRISRARSPSNRLRVSNADCLFADKRLSIGSSSRSCCWTYIAFSTSSVVWFRLRLILQQVAGRHVVLFFGFTVDVARLRRVYRAASAWASFRSRSVV